MCNFSVNGIIFTRHLQPKMLKVQMNDISNSFLVNFDCIFMLRYKMTCEYTWPNHLMSTDQEAVEAIVNQHGFEDDVAYGHTKLFVRTPRTLFTLEQERAALIPILVLFLQKVTDTLFTFLSLSVNFLGHFRSLSISIVYCCSWGFTSSASCLSLPFISLFSCSLLLSHLIIFDLLTFSCTCSEVTRKHSGIITPRR